MMSDRSVSGYGDVDVERVTTGSTNPMVARTLRVVSESSRSYRMSVHF